MKHHALQLYDFHVWANKLIFDHLKKLPQKVAETEVQSVFPSVNAALAHIYIIDTMWLGVISGGTFEEARATHPDREITIYHPKTGEATTRISELVQHVVNHGTYHRGQVTAILRQLGHPGVPTDYAFFIFK